MTLVTILFIKTGHHAYFSSKEKENIPIDVLKISFAGVALEDNHVITETTSTIQITQKQQGGAVIFIRSHQYDNTLQVEIKRDTTIQDVKVKIQVHESLTLII